MAEVHKHDDVIVNLGDIDVRDLITKTLGEFAEGQDLASATGVSLKSLNLTSLIRARFGPLAAQIGDDSIHELATRVKAKLDRTVDMAEKVYTLSALNRDIDEIRSQIGESVRNRIATLGLKLDRNQDSLKRDHHHQLYAQLINASLSPKEFGAIIKRLSEITGVSQGTLARECGLDQTLVSKCMHGHFPMTHNNVILLRSWAIEKVLELLNKEPTD